MKTRARSISILAGLIPPALLAATLFILPPIAEVAMDSTMPLRLPPPVALSSWRTEPVSFCQNIDCLSAIHAPNAAHEVCPKCGSATDSVSLAERRILPPDTDIFHKRYVDDNGNVISLSAVVSGQSRSSIHKPEYCLPSQGLSILNDAPHTLALNTDRTIDLRLLDVAAPNATGLSQKALFFYWYESRHKQTGSQFSKNLAMITDRLFKGRIDRWAYVSLLVPYSSDRERAVKIVDEFTKELYPLLEKPQGNGARESSNVLKSEDHI